MKIKCRTGLRDRSRKWKREKLDAGYYWKSKQKQGRQGENRDCETNRNRQRWPKAMSLKRLSRQMGEHMKKLAQL